MGSNPGCVLAISFYRNYDRNIQGHTCFYLLSEHNRHYLSANSESMTNLVFAALECDEAFCSVVEMGDTRQKIQYTRMIFFPIVNNQYAKKTVTKNHIPTINIKFLCEQENI